MVKRLYHNMEERLFANSLHEDGCWIWLGKRMPNGYGRLQIWRNGRSVSAYAHRVSYETFIGPIPPDHDLDHRPECSRCCIHPNHLTPRPWLEHRLKTGFPRANPPAR